MAGSKKYRDKLCVYCRVNISKTEDHVFPREFFQISERCDLPKVPSCRECNNKKSQIEHYLTAVLPFGATHPNANHALVIDVKKRLSKNKRLHRELQGTYSQGVTYDTDEGSVSTDIISINQVKIHKFCEYVALGLLFYHWQIILPLNLSCKVFTPSEDGSIFINNLLNKSSKLNVHEKLGDSTIKYKGVASEIGDGFSVWKIQLLGGITLSDSGFNNVCKDSVIAVITGSNEALGKLDQYIPI